MTTPPSPRTVSPPRRRRSYLIQLYAWMPGLSPARSLPEAAFSLTLKGTLDGQEALLTARGQTAAEFKANSQAIRGLLDPVPGTGPGHPGRHRPAVPDAWGDEAEQQGQGVVLSHEAQ